MAAQQSPDIKARKRRFSQYLHHSAPIQQKQPHPSFPPAIFWDQLSELPFTKNALRELARRIALQSSCDQNTAQGVEHPGSVELQLSPSLLKQIQHFARHGGPDLSTLRGYPVQGKMNPSPPSLDRSKTGSQPPESVYVTSTPSLGPYDRAFEQHLIDHHILPNGYEYPDGQLPPEPDNINAILEVLKRPRAPLPASTFSTDADFRKFQRANTQAKNQRDVITTILPMIEGEIVDRKCVAGGIPLTNLDHLTDGTLVAGNPDLFHGARPEQLDRNVRKQLDGLVVPSTQHDLPIAPNFLLQVKGFHGSIAVALLQACYNGTLGARAMLSLQSYGRPSPIYDNKAYVLTSIYHFGILMMFTVHPLPPAKPDREPGYIMTHLNSWSMTGNYDSFLQGATAYRNGLDWAKQQRDEAIKRANYKKRPETI